MKMRIGIIWLLIGLLALLSGAVAASSNVFPAFGIIALTLVTGTLHLLLGLAGDRLLLLNGIGYIGLLGLLFLPIGLPQGLKKGLRFVLILYTLITIAGYFYQHSITQFDALAISSKIVEVVLIILLAMRIAEVQNMEG